MPATAREVAGLATRVIVGYVRAARGDEGVAAVLERAGEPRSAADLEDERTWSSQAQVLALLRAARDVLGDPMVARRMGASTLDQQVGQASRLLLRALGSVESVYRSAPRGIVKFSTVTECRLLDAGPEHATLTYRPTNGRALDRLECDFISGVLSSLPRLFGLPPARVVHRDCLCGGAPACRYEVSWSKAHRRRRPRKDYVALLEAELGVLKEQLQALRTTAADLVSPDGVESALAGIARRLGTTVQAQHSVVAIRLQEGAEPLVFADGVPPAGVRALADDLLAGRIAPAPSRLVVDVVSPRRRYGRILVAYDSGAEFFLGDQELLDAYAHLAATALDAATALEDTRQREATAAQLLGLARELARRSTEAEVAQCLLAAVPGVTGADQGVIWGYDASGCMRVVAAQGFPPALTARLSALEVGLADTPELGSFLADPGLRVYDRSTADPFVRRLLTEFGSARAAVLPLVAGGTLLGAVVASWAAGGAPGPVEASLWQRLRGLADQGATALSNARLLDQVRHQALHDALTGLPNRTLFVDRVTHALERSRREGTRLAVLFVDLDGFKVVNDTLGHEAGDAVLRAVAERIRGCLRASETPGRLGGDEFAVLLEGTIGDEDAIAVAERMLAALAEPVRAAEREITVAASVGIALGALDDSADVLLRNADAAMYQVKSRSCSGGFALFRDLGVIASS